MDNYDLTYTGAEIQAILDTAKKLKDSGYIFLGVATPSTNPGTPTQKVYYEAKQAGTYTNFGGAVLPDGISLLIWDGSWTLETVMCGDGGVFDITAYKSSGGTLAKYADLAAALDGGNNIPVGVRKGGMSVKFVQSSDNKYIQARCTANEFTTDITKWQSVDDVPTPGSINVVESGILGTRLERINKREYSLSNTGGYISKSNGRYNAYAKSVYSDFIPCEPGQHIRLNLLANDSLGVCFYTSNSEGSFISGSGINANNEVVTVPNNAYFLRASSRNTYPSPSVVFEDTKSLVDIPSPKTNNIWIPLNDSSVANIDSDRVVVNGVYICNRREYYNIVKDIRLIGFDKSKKHTLYILWYDNNKFSFRISEYDETNSVWNVVFNYTITSGYTASNSLNIDYIYNGKRVIGSFECSKRFEGNTFNALNASPEYIFDKCCYNDVIIDDINEMPVQDKVLNGETFDIDTSDFNIGGYINASGKQKPDERYGYTDYIACKEGQIFIAQLAINDNTIVAFYSAKDESSFISGYTSYDTFKQFTVPQGALWMRLSNNFVTLATPYAYLSNPEYDGLIELSNKEKQNRPIVTPIKLFPKTKLPCVSFQFDDCDANDEQIVSLFESYNKTCAFAFIASEKNMVGLGAKYEGYQKRGFQIMNHSISGTELNLNNYTYQTALTAIMTARKRIEDAGMICNGFVCPSSEIEETFKPILSIAHSYAFTTITNDTTVNGRNADRCNLHRHSIQDIYTLEQLKDFIDDCITNDQIITFYGHAHDLVENGDTTVFSIAKIQALIEYCIQKEQDGELYFRGTDECVKYFFDL